MAYCLQLALEGEWCAACNVEEMGETASLITLHPLTLIYIQTQSALQSKPSLSPDSIL